MFNWVKKPNVAANVIARKLTAPLSAPWLIAAGLGLQSLSLSAQELEAPLAVRDTFSISSGNFSRDYANNVDYAQFAMDVKSASGRLALYGFDKYADRLNGTFLRLGYLAGSGLLTASTGIHLTYHERAHASRMLA